MAVEAYDSSLGWTEREHERSQSLYSVLAFILETLEHGGNVENRRSVKCSRIYKEVFIIRECFRYLLYFTRP